MACPHSCCYAGSLNEKAIAVPETAPDDIETSVIDEQEVARSLAELVIEAVESCIKDQTWHPKTGVVGFEDTLEETWIRARTVV